MVEIENSLTVKCWLKKKKLKILPLGLLVRINQKFIGSWLLDENGDRLQYRVLE